MDDSADRGTFEWVADWEQLREVLSPTSLGLPPTARVVDVGCGTSTLPLHLATMYTSVVGADREPHCAASMSAMHANSEGLCWVTCDVTTSDTAALDATLPEGSSELVVDKGTLDCALTEDEASRLLCNVARMLSSGGVYVVISFRKRELLVPLLTCDQLPWTVEHRPLLPATGLGSPSSICIMRKCASAGGMPPSVDVVSAHLQAIQDQWYQHDNPLLTAEREAHLREAWSTAAMRQQDRPPRGVLPTDHLPLAVAFEVLFTPEERGEIGIDGFVSDLLDGDPTHGEGRGKPSGVPEAPRSIGLEEALAYLRREQ